MEKLVSGTICSICKRGRLQFTGIDIMDNKIYRSYECNNKDCNITHNVETPICVNNTNVAV